MMDLIYKGLSSEDALKLQAKFGKNTFSKEDRFKVLKLIIKQFTDLMILVLIFAGIISIWFGEEIDGTIIFIIVIFNAIIGFFQEYKAERILAKLKEKLEPKCIVYRDKKFESISREDILPGDIVKITEGNVVPADGVIVKNLDISIDESVLTGESLPVSKSVYSVSIKKFSDIKNIIDKEYKLFMGTSVRSGYGLMIVSNIGENTEFGKIAKLTVNVEKQKSPLEEEVIGVGKYVGYMTLIISVFLIFFGIFVKEDSISQSILFSASVAVAAVPEGLPTVITIALAFGVQKLARRKTLVRHLSSVESLGETTVICSDKTGTLTQNKMQIKKIYTSFGDVFDVENVEGYNIESGEIISRDQYGKFGKKHKSWNELLSNFPKYTNWSNLSYKVLEYCNDSSISKIGLNYELLGDPTEGALKWLAKKMNYSMKFEEINRISFSSERKMMSVLIKSDNENLIVTKGAPEVLFKKCSHFYDFDGSLKKITSKLLSIYQNKVEEFSNTGLRVLALAYKITDKNTMNISDEDDFVFLGLFAIYDPPRFNIRESFSLTKKAGIRTIIITGDNPKTAIAIAKEIQIFDKNENIIAYTHEDLEKISDVKLSKILHKNNKDKIIFARVMPKDKLRIVEILQKQNEIVAVTGDGINDAPALRKAHIGIAMGDGTDVSKEASHIVLLDNSFSTIVEAIRLGREVYSNLRKFSWYVFSSNTGELFTVFVSIILAIPSPLTAITILLINLGTDILPAISLSKEDEGVSIMDNPPKPRNQKIMNVHFIIDFLTTGLVIGGIVMSQYFITLMSFGWTYGQDIDSTHHIIASSVAFVSLVMVQLANSWNARNLNLSIFKMKLNNIWHLFAVFSSTCLVVMFTTIPVFQRLFGLTSLDLSQWIGIFVSMFLIIVVSEIKKKFFLISSS